jgi:hypothetical protein
VQSGDGGAALVWQGAEEGDAEIIYDKFHINSHFLFIGSDLWSVPKVNL